MKRIKKITIDNFQSHKHTVIEPDDNLTVIVGHTDSGKSAFIRAMRWCLYNKAPHSPLIKKDQDFAKVLIEFSDGTSILRYKSANKKDNYYKIVNEKGEEKVFTSVGNAPLKEVMDISGMYEINMFNTDLSLNMTDQHDSLFFLAENPTDRGTLISQMANTEIVDNAISICSAKINSTKRLITQTQKSIKEKQESLAEYNYLEELGIIIDELKAKKERAVSESARANKIDLSRTSVSDLKNIVMLSKAKILPLDDIQCASSKLEGIEDKTALASKITTYKSISDSIAKTIVSLGFLKVLSKEDVDALLAKLSSLEDDFLKRNAFSQKLSSFKECELKLKGFSDKISNEDILDVSNKIEKISSLYEKGEKIKSKISGVHSYIKEGENAKANIDSYEESKSNLKKEYENMLKSSEKCPVCGNAMNEDHIHAAGDLL